MKKSLIAFVIGIAALGFANSAKADVTAGVAGTLEFSASSSQVDGLMQIDGNTDIMGGYSYDASGVVNLWPSNDMQIFGHYEGAGSVNASVATASKGSAGATSAMVTSLSGASLSVVDSGAGVLTHNTVNGLPVDDSMGMSIFQATGDVSSTSYGANLPILGASSFAGM